MGEAYYGHRLISGCDEPGVCYEYMDQHLRGMRIVYDRYYASRYNRFVNNLLLRWQGHRELCSKLPYLALALHDLGKAIYQDTLRSSCKAPRHEIASASLAWYMTKGVLCNRCKIVLALTILLHHHAMRPPNKLLEQIDGYAREYSERIHAKYSIDNVVNYMNVAFSIYGISWDIRLININDLLDSFKAMSSTFSRLVKAKSNGLFSKMPKFKEEYFGIYRLALTLLQPLIVSDITSARLQRRPPCKNLEASDVSEVDEEMLREVIDDSSKCNVLAEALRQKLGVKS